MTDFITELTSIAPAVGRGDYAFTAADGGRLGIVQIIRDSERQITIHRLWTLKPGGGNGTIMMRALCDLADRHGVELKLKPLPFGRRPYPMNREQLLGWYARLGFEGSRRRMVRKPRAILAVV